MLMLDDDIEFKNSMIAERRIGIINYSNEFLQTTERAILKKVFGSLIPIDVSFDYADQTFMMKAFSENFDPVDPGTIIPRYRIIVKIVRGNRKSPAYILSFEKEESFGPLAGLFTNV